MGAVRHKTPLRNKHALPTAYFGGQATRLCSRSRSRSRSPRGVAEARQRRATSEYAQAPADHVNTGEAADLITMAQHMAAATGATLPYTAPVDRRLLPSTAKHWSARRTRWSACPTSFTTCRPCSRRCHQMRC